MRCFLAFTIIILFYSSPLYSQIEVFENPEKTVIGEVSNGMQMHLSIVKYTRKEAKSYYQIIYKDFRYPNLYELESITISNEETIQDLKKIVFDMFDNTERSMSLSFKLEEELATLVKKRQMGVTTVTLLVDRKGHSNGFLRRQWEKAFENLQ
jgi:hypothetical protein